MVDRKPGAYFCYGATRLVVLALSTGCLTLIISNSLALNFTVICMESTGTNNNNNNNNGTENDKVTAVPMFSLQEQSWLFSAIAVGQLLGTLPITAFITHFGIRQMFTGYGLISALATLAIPTSLSLGGFPALMLSRVFQGFGAASVWVVIGGISAQWAPLASSAVFLSVLSCNLQFGPILSMPLAAQLCLSQEWGWPAVYHILGTISLLAFGLFFFFFRDLPRQQKNVSAQELALIEAGKWPFAAQECQKEVHKIPYRAILTDTVFWGIFTSTAAANTGFQIFWQYGPLFLNKTLGLEVAETGMAAALPFLLSAIFKISAGQLSDRISFCSEKTKVIFFASISQYLMAACFLAMALLPSLDMTNLFLMRCCFTGATVFSGLNAVGIVKSTQQVSRHLSHALFAWNTLMLSVIMLVLPLVVSWLTPTNSVTEWAHVFYFITAIVVAGTTFFNFTAEVEPRPWAELPTNGKEESFKEEQRIFTVEGKKRPFKLSS